jgi:alkylhydroperoxidase family enzyme
VSPYKVPEEVYRRLESYFTPAEIVALTAFGALMVATNVVNNALDVELDEYLQPYRKGVRESAALGSRS